MTENVFIEITYPDGTIARWAIPDDDTRVTQMETLLGAPDTLKV